MIIDDINDTGATFDLIKNYINYDILKFRFGCLIENKSSKFKSNYWGKLIDKKLKPKIFSCQNILLKFTCSQNPFILKGRSRSQFILKAESQSHFILKGRSQSCFFLKGWSRTRFILNGWITVESCLEIVFKSLFNELR